MSGSRKAIAYARRILVKHEYGKEIAKNHASENQTDAAKHEQPPSTERSERGQGVFMRNGVQGRGCSLGHDG